MPDTAIVVIDADESHDVSGVENAVNGLVKRAENSGQPLFYIIPEGKEIPDSIGQPAASSVLRYQNEDNWYEESRIDEAITNRDVGNVVFLGASSKEAEFEEKEQKRGRSPQKGGGGNSGNGNNGKGNNGKGN